MSGPVGKLCARCRAPLCGRGGELLRYVSDRYANRICTDCWYDEEITLEELGDAVTAQENAECEWQSMLAQCEARHSGQPARYCGETTWLRIQSPGAGEVWMTAAE